MKVVIGGRTHYAAPVLELTNPVYQVQGVIEFTPRESGHYFVQGTLDKDYSAVWIEDADAGQPVPKKIEVNGSAKPGFFEK